MHIQGGQEEAPLLYFHIIVLMLSSPNKQTEKPVGRQGGGTEKKIQNAVPACLPHEGCK